MDFSIPDSDNLMGERQLYKQHSHGDAFRPQGFYWFRYSSWHAGSRLSRLPPILRQLGMFVRNWRQYWRPRRIRLHYLSDNMATRVLIPFMDDDVFERSYERMILASGYPNDPGIHYRIHQAIWAASVCSNVEGDFVECGTGRGLVFSAILESLSDWPSMKKQVWLFDTFSPHVLDPTSGKPNPSGIKHSRYAVSLEQTKRNFLEWDRVNLVAGSLPHSLNEVRIESIAFLHIDLNHAETEKEVLQILWPRVTKGGIVLLDDYGGNEAQNSAMREVADQLGIKILSTGNTAGIIVKS